MIARKNSDSAIEIDGLTGGRDRQECEPPPKSISPAESPQVRVARSDNGFEVTLDELMRTGEHPLLWSVDERMRLRRRRETGCVRIRSQEVIRLTLLSGRELELTAGQQALKLDGWKSIADLSNGDRIAVLRRLSEPAQTRRMHDSEVIMLAHMIGDGSCISGGDEQARRGGGVEGSSQLGFQDQPTQARRISRKGGGIRPNDPVYVARACCR